MPLSRSRDPERLRFTTSTARTLRLPTAPDAPPLLPWPLAALGGGLVAAVAGTLLVAGVMLVAWFSAIAIPLATMLDFAAQVWLLAHGGVVVIGTDQLTLVPLGLTAGAAALCSSAGRFAYRQGRQARTGDLTAAARRTLLLGSIGQVAAGYTVFAAVLAWVVTGPALAWRPALGAFVVSAAGSAVGACLAAGFRPPLPDWLGRGFRGAVAGGLGLVVVAGVVLATAVALGEPRVAALEESLGLDTGGVVVWSVALLAYLPNLLAWALAWVLGAGFTVGTGSVVSLSGTQLGMLPAIPVLGALPGTGVGDPWLLSWLAAGVAVGALAGFVAVRGGRTGPLGALAAGAAAGLLVGLVHLGWAALSRGGLGSLRLVGLGPRLLETLLIPVPLLLLSSVLGGLVTWFVRRRRIAS
jgi:hypothetical protein